MKLAERFSLLGTETAFAVAAEARRHIEKGSRVCAFHLGDIDLKTPDNIIEATYKAMRDGKTGWALIDTGASYTVVGRELARGLKDSGHRRIVTTNSGRQELPVFEIDSFSFAGITCDSIKHIACADIAELQRKSGLSIDAIIGMDVLSEFALHIDCSLGILQVSSFREVLLCSDGKDKFLVTFRADQKLRFKTVSH